MAADEWLEKVIHQSPAFQAQVEEARAAITVAQDLVALGDHVDVSIRPRRQARKSRQRAGVKTKKPAAVRSPGRLSEAPENLSERRGGRAA